VNTVTVLGEVGVDDVADVSRKADRPLAIASVLGRRVLVRPVGEEEIRLRGVVIIDVEAAESAGSSAVIPLQREADVGA
jgi:hypothetical protein